LTPDLTKPVEPGIDPRTGLPGRAEEADSPDPMDSLEPEASDEEREEIERELLNAETIRRLAENLRHGGKIGDLSPGDRARVDQLVGAGQENIAKGEFFAAERNFTDALALNPGNPMLIAGLGNSQLGAGLYLSAALSFRELFSSYPEMIDTRYEVRLLPKEARLRQAVEALRARIAGKTDADSFGLLLAYLGHQLEDRPLILEGLAEVTGNPGNDVLRALLQEVWMPGRSESSAK
jgi:tetratricopeptide (TPR) repeat protein